jgi:hypothetical protein
VPFAATTFGVYENVPGQRHQALLFSEEQLTVLGTDGVTCVRFADVERVVLPTKAPVSRSLSVVMRPGETLEIPAFGPRGGFRPVPIPPERHGGVRWRSAPGEPSGGTDLA